MEQSSPSGELETWVTDLLNPDQQESLRRMLVEWNATRTFGIQSVVSARADTMISVAAVDELVGSLDQLVPLAVRVAETCTDATLRALCLRIASRCSMDASSVKRQQLFPTAP